MNPIKKFFGKVQSFFDKRKQDKIIDKKVKEPPVLHNAPDTTRKTTGAFGRYKGNPCSRKFRRLLLNEYRHGKTKRMEKVLAIRREKAMLVKQVNSETT